MKNFDEVRRERIDRDREFIIGGETFAYRAGVRPEVIVPWYQLQSGESLRGENALTQEEQLKVMDDTVIAFLEDGYEEKWRAVRARTETPVTLKDMDSLIEWLIEEGTGRPTEQLSDSGSGSGSQETTTTSTVSSPSEAETP